MYFKQFFLVLLRFYRQNDVSIMLRHIWNCILCLFVFTAHNASFDVPSTGYNSSPGSDRDCDPVRIRNRTPTVEQLDKMLTDIRKNLTVAKANLSSNIRKRKSASDPRTSSRIIGMTLGVIIICLSASLVIIPDMLAVLNFVVSKCIRQCMTT